MWDGRMEYIKLPITVLSSLALDERLTFVNKSTAGFLPLCVDMNVHPEKVVQHVPHWYAGKIQANGINEPPRIGFRGWIAMASAIE